MDTTTDQPVLTRAWHHLQMIWNSRQGQILLVIISLILYMADVITDIMLAVQYYNNGDYHWFGWTILFVIGPSIILNLHLANFQEGHLSKCVKYMYMLQLGVLLEYFDHLHSLLHYDNLGDSMTVRLSHTHLVEAMLESVPQLCLQIYIIDSTHEQVSVLKVITMVISLLTAVKAVVTYLYHTRRQATDEGSNLKLVITLTIWKVIELSVRVLVLGLLASAWPQWVILCIGLHWLMVMYLIILRSDSWKIRGYDDVLRGSLHVAVGTFSTTFPQECEEMYGANFVTTVFGNFMMALFWVQLKLEMNAKWNWYYIPATVTMFVGNITSFVFSFILFEKLCITDNANYDL